MTTIKLKPGDRVTVYRKVRYTYWLSCMDTLIGESGTVTDIRTLYTYTNRYSSVPEAKIKFDNESYTYYFPTTSLKHERN